MTTSIPQPPLRERAPRKVRLPAMLFALGRACAAAGARDRGPVPPHDPPRLATRPSGS